MDIYQERQEVAGKSVTSFFVDMDDIRLNCLLNFVVMDKFKIPEGYGEEMQELIRLGYVSTNGLSGNQTEYYVTEYGHEVLREGGIAMARKRKEAEERMRKEIEAEVRADFEKKYAAAAEEKKIGRPRKEN